jgi:hypothetical protein
MPSRIRTPTQANPAAARCHGLSTVPSSHRGATMSTAVTSKIGSPNGASRRAPFDRWFRYAAGFSGETLDRCFEAFAGKDGLILDPFAGVATTGTRAVAEGHPFRGIEVHPLVAEVAALKFSFLDEETVRDLERTSNEIMGSTDIARSRVAAETSLVRRSFDEDTLAQLIAIREQFEVAESRLKPYLRCALIGTLRDVASVNVGWPYQRPAVQRKPPHRSATKRFRERVQWLIEDLATVSIAGDARIVVGDSRTAASWRAALGDAKAQICLSSPPYLNNFDYADATRLELYFLGAIRSWAELCSEVRFNMITATTQQSTQARAEAAWKTLARLPRTVKGARDLSARLEAQRRERPRGKEYDQVLPIYLADIFQVLMRAHKHLDEGAMLAWVVGDSAPYGVYLNTPALICGVAEAAGFVPLKDVTLRVRGSRWALNGTRHQVALSERLIVLRRGN